MRATIVILSNAIDDATRLSRNIFTDSPAASHKVFMMAAALRGPRSRVFVLSAGRGRPDRSWRLFRGCVGRFHGAIVIYLPFSHVPLISELMTMWAAIPLLRRLSRHAGAEARVLIAYNRWSAYIPSLIWARLLRWRVFIDIEDGETRVSSGSSVPSRLSLKARLFDALCVDGAILACSALASQTRLKRRIRYYGIADPSMRLSDRDDETLRVLLGGTVSPETGAQMLVEAISILRLEHATEAGRLEFVITGSGDSLADFSRLQSSPLAPTVRVLGRLEDLEYGRLLSRCHVGLALKSAGGRLAHTTFPSKVVELASAGLLVVTTDISDVRVVLGDGALYVVPETGGNLAGILLDIARHPSVVRCIAERGRQSVMSLCDRAASARALEHFLLG